MTARRKASVFLLVGLVLLLVFVATASVTALWLFIVWLVGLGALGFTSMARGNRAR